MTGDNTSNNFLEQAQFVWNFLGPVLGGLATFFFRKWLIKYKIRYQEHRTARNNFISAFSPLCRELDDIGYKNSLEDIDKILNNYHSIIKEAKITFSNTISNRKKLKLQRLWLKYCDEDEKRINKPIRYTRLSVKEPGKNKTTIEMRDAMLQCIDELLESANHG